MEWEIPVLKDLNMATLAASCDPGGMVDSGLCGPAGSEASSQCDTGSGGAVTGK